MLRVPCSPTLHPARIFLLATVAWVNFSVACTVSEGMRFNRAVVGVMALVVSVLAVGCLGSSSPDPAPQSVGDGAARLAHTSLVSYAAIPRVDRKPCARSGLSPCQAVGIVRLRYVLDRCAESGSCSSRVIHPTRVVGLGDLSRANGCTPTKCGFAAILTSPPIPHSGRWEITPPRLSDGTSAASVVFCVKPYTTTSIVVTYHATTSTAVTTSKLVSTATDGLAERDSVFRVYPAERVTVARAPAAYTPPVSRRDVLASFLARNVPVTPTPSSENPRILLADVTERAPSYPGLAPGGTYPAWVVTYPRTRAVSYGPAFKGGHARCRFVAIYDLKIRAWTTYFQSCR